MSDLTGHGDLLCPANLVQPCWCGRIIKDLLVRFRHNLQEGRVGTQVDVILSEFEWRRDNGKAMLTEVLYWDFLYHSLELRIILENFVECERCTSYS
jgi:hypothetical protein